MEDDIVGRVIDQGFFEKPDYYIHSNIKEDIRPCDSCHKLKTCDDLNCKVFKDWCNQRFNYQIDDKDYITLFKASELAGYTQKTIKKLIDSNHIVAKRHRSVLFINKNDISKIKKIMNDKLKELMEAL